MKAENGKTVHIHYKGTLKDGKTFDSSEGRDPLAFTLGSGQVIPGFEKGVEGMQKGEKKTITIPVDQAYGPVRAELMQEVPRDKLPQDQEPQVGMQLVMQAPTGQQIPARIAKVDEKTVTLDLNHPLAGQELTFDLELVDVTDKPPKKEGCCGGNCHSGDEEEKGSCGSGSCGDTEEKQGCGNC